jgi:site-specific DNA recombinase
MIAAIYARKSTDQSTVAEEARSVARQVENARAYASKRGWTVDDSKIFVDDGISGAEFANRPGYMRLLNALKPRASFDILIVSELSRLGREQLETGYAVKQLSQAGVRIFSYLEDREILLDTPTDKFLMAAVSFAAEIERDKARQRVTDAMARKASQGHVCGGDCFGYRNVEVKDLAGRRSHVDREINEEQAEVVRRIFSMCAAGQGLKTIAKQLNAERLPSPRPRLGRPRSWTTSTVRTVLYRDLYRGILVWNKRRRSDAWGQRVSRRRPEGEWLRVGVPHLRIVSDAAWDAAHQRIGAARLAYLAINHGRAGGRPPAQLESRYLLSGLGSCSKCGASMTVRSGTHGNSQRFVYACASYDRRGRTVCDNGLRLPMIAADDAILSELRDHVLQSSVVEGAIRDALAELLPGRDAIEQRRAGIETELRKVEEEQARLVAAIAGGRPLDALSKALQEREYHRSRLIADLDALAKTSRRAVGDAARLERELHGRLQEWRALLKRHTPLTRQIVTRLLDGKIVWTPHKDERRYEYQGKVTLDHLLTGNVFTEGGIPVRGFEPRSRG